MSEFVRVQKIVDAQEDSVFLWGARQVGKSTLVKSVYPNAKIYDLLKSDEYTRLLRRPQLLREELLSFGEETLVVIDEIQKIPQLLDEVHWLIVNRGIRFILCGSSARKLKRQGVNTLGGRAMVRTLYPLVSAEIPDFELDRAINQGLLPRHYMAKPAIARERLKAYISVYLKEEIKAESLVRSLQTFNRFLEVAALTNGEMVNYSNIANDCGIDSKTVKEYFAILEETHIGYMVPAYQKVVKRKLRQSPRFYYFDVAIPNYLLSRHNLQQGSADYGHAFEHLLMQELIAYMGYRKTEVFKKD